MPPPRPTAPGSGQGKGLVTGWDGGASAARRLWLSRNERRGGSVVEQAEGGVLSTPGTPRWARGWHWGLGVPGVPGWLLC